MPSFLNLFKRKEQTTENKDLPLPLHIAVIPDGNRRWARKRGLPVEVGHKEGANVFKKVVTAASEIGIKYITFYTFSTENWNRPQKEVDALMGLMLGFLRNAENELAGRDVRIRVIGRRAGLSEELIREISRVEDITRANQGIIVNIAINYGSRDEILNAVKSIADRARRHEIRIDDINEELLSNSLYTVGCPEPELMIRTSGEKRTSNFLLWQMAYTEFWFTDKLWPDFNKEDLQQAIDTYQNRSRRFGV